MYVLCISRIYSTLDHDDVWRIHLLVISEAKVEPTHQHYHDILHIDEQYKAEIKRLRVHPSFQQKAMVKCS